MMRRRVAAPFGVNVVGMPASYELDLRVQFTTRTLARMGNSRLSGRTALVTGSTDGIGVGVAQALAAEGAHVIVTGRNAERGGEVIDQISAGGGQANFVWTDLAGGSGALLDLVAQATALAGGPLDILVNNAAQLINPAPTADVDEQLIDQALAVNVKSVFLLTGLVAPTMAARGHGAIVNVGSISGLIGMGGSALYGMTKAAIHSLTKSWAAEYGPSGVRVNTVAPGPTLTARNEEIKEHLAPMLARLPSGRASTLAEVAAAVVFLASDDAANIHGAMLSVDGGWAAI
jgi:NAD(P)-dependent dehydrogenase (short-subunit alcohol dehydrogenase family)